MPKYLISNLSLIAVISAIISVVLMMTRTYHAVSFDIPLQGPTRGGEFETVYSIWLYVQGLTVYRDPGKIPFIASFYNWMFYVSYGEIVRFFLWVLSLEDAWLPTITRLTTLGGCVIGTVVSSQIYIKHSCITDRPFVLIAGSFSVLTFLGPLVGFHGISTTSDIWAMVITIVGISYFMTNYPKFPLRSTLVTCLFSYLAWSFKQNFLYLPATVGFYLLFRKDWMNAALLAVVPIIAFGITMVIGGPDYRHILAFTDTARPFSWGDILKLLLMNVSVKVLPLLCALLVSFWIFLRNREILFSLKKKLSNRPELIVPFIGCIVSLLEGVFTSGFLFSSENHYFSFLLFANFSVLILLQHLSENSSISVSSIGVLGIGWLGNFLAVGSVLLGINGMVSVRPFHDNLVIAKNCFPEIREPVYFENPYLALPWMTPATQHFVTNFNYATDRAMGIEKEGNGIGGLIDRGYFNTIMLSGSHPGVFDGSAMKKYRKDDTCAGFSLYRRTDG